MRQSLIHRHKLVRLRVTVKNELQHLAMNRGITRGRRLWNKTGEQVLRELTLPLWAARRREDLFKVRGMFDEQIAALDQAVIEAAEKNEQAKLLMTQPGVGRERIQFRREATAGVDQQAGEPLYAHVAGRSGTERGAPRSADA